MSEQQNDTRLIAICICLAMPMCLAETAEDKMPTAYFSKTDSTQGETSAYFPEGSGPAIVNYLLIISRRDFRGLTNREIGHRLGHADGATDGKRVAQLSSDADLRHGIRKAVVKVKKCSIDNCKA